MLFGSDCLVLFYEDFDTEYRYTCLGAVDVYKRQVYDLKEKRTLYSSLLSVETVKQLLKLAALEQAMPHILLEQCIVQKSHCEQMERFGMEMCIRDSVILSEAESVFAAGRNGPQIGVCNLRLRKCKARLVVFNGRLD